MAEIVEPSNHPMGVGLVQNDTASHRLTSCWKLDSEQQPFMDDDRLDVANQGIKQFVRAFVEFTVRVVRGNLTANDVIY